VVSGAFSRYRFFSSVTSEEKKCYTVTPLRGFYRGYFRFLQTQSFLPFGGLDSLPRPRPDGFPVALGYKGFLGGAGFGVFAFDMIYFF
jgi:hypothetical protein